MAEKSKRVGQPARGCLRIVVEFIVALIVLSVIGGLLSYLPPAFGITSFYRIIAQLIVLALGVAMMLTLIRVPLTRKMEMRGERHFASTVSFFATLILAVAAFLALLSIFSISFSTLLLAVGGISIIVGFAVSTITTNIISGAFMLTSYPIKVGQRIIITVNNQLGTITNVGTLFMTVTTDAGAKLIIPNSAVFQGMAFLLDVKARDPRQEEKVPRLLAKPGDRVVSSLYPYPATVAAVTSVATELVTDTGQLLTIPNQAILNGNSALIVLGQHPQETTDAALANLPIAIGDEIRLSAGFTGKVTEIGSYYFRISGTDEDVVIPTSSLTSGGILIFKKRRTQEQQDQLKVHSST